MTGRRMGVRGGICIRVFLYVGSAAAQQQNFLDFGKECGKKEIPAPGGRPGSKMPSVWETRHVSPSRGKRGKDGVSVTGGHTQDMIWGVFPLTSRVRG